METNKELIQQINEAFGKGDKAFFSTHVADDVQWNIPGQDAIIGKDSFMETLDSIFQENTPQVTIKNTVTEGDYTVVESTDKGTAVKTDKAYNHSYCDIYLLKDGKIQEMTSYMADNSAGNTEQSNSNLLGNGEAMATIAVKDMEAAQKFYEDIAGLEQVHKMDGAVNYKSGNSTVLVYQSEFAGTNKATSASWVVADIDAVVQSLKAKGVNFEHYDFPGTTIVDDVHVSENMKVAWFKDPDGNIININQISKT